MAHVLVLGGTGKTGRRLVSRLRQAGADPVAASRHDAGPAAAGGVRHVRFDWDDQVTWEPALRGAAAVYVVPPAFAVDHTAAVTAFLGAVASAGVPRAVLLTARGADAADTPLRREELALEASGLGWAVVRPSWFMQNLTEGAFAGMVEAGTLAVPTGSGANPMIDADDISAVAARLLLDESLDGLAYDLSGPEALTFEQAAKLLGEARGRDLRFVDADPQEWVAATVAAGVPAGLRGLPRRAARAGPRRGRRAPLRRRPAGAGPRAAGLRDVGGEPPARRRRSVGVGHAQHDGVPGRGPPAPARVGPADLPASPDASSTWAPAQVLPSGTSTSAGSPESSRARGAARRARAGRTRTPARARRGAS